MSKKESNKKKSFFSEYNKTRNYDFMRGKNNPNYKNPKYGKNNPNYGRKHTLEEKNKMSLKMQKRWSDPNEHIKQSKIMIEYYKNHPEFFQHISDINKGKIISKEQRQKQSKTLKERYKKYPETHPNYRMKKEKMTKIEKQMYKILDFNDLDFIFQFPIVCKNGTKYVDFCLPNYKIIIECDGLYWHKDKKKDDKRDNDILETIGTDWTIEHILDFEINNLSKFLGIEVI